MVSSLINLEGTPARVLFAAMLDELVLSYEILAEVQKAVRKPYIQKVVPAHKSNALLVKLTEIDLIRPTTTITDCRDPKDNHILALALDGKADMIVTGDDDLLVLHLWRTIPILNAADALLKLT